MTGYKYRGNPDEILGTILLARIAVIALHEDEPMFGMSSDCVVYFGDNDSSQTMQKIAQEYLRIEFGAPVDLGPVEVDL